MQDERLPKLALKYQPEGKRSTGRLRKNGKTTSWRIVEEYRNKNLVNSSKRRRRVSIGYFKGTADEN
jgi:hypothetical protein